MTENTPFSFEFNPNGIEAEEAANQNWSFQVDEDGLPVEHMESLFPDANPRTEDAPLDPATQPQVEGVKHDTDEYKSRPALERTRELFAYMNPHRIALLGILQAAHEPISTVQMEEVVATIQGAKFTVYSPANLCTMLEQAGALTRVNEDGTPYANAQPEPEIVVIDGEEYYKPTSPAPVFWLTSEAGAVMLEENDPLARMRALLESENEFAGIYKQVLLCVRAAGASMSDLSEKVDANPLIAKPRRFFVQHFVEGLERCEALAWQQKRWTITPMGTRILDELLADVEAAAEFERTERSKPVDRSVVPTETQGVNW